MDSDSTNLKAPCSHVFTELCPGARSTLVSLSLFIPLAGKDSVRFDIEVIGPETPIVGNLFIVPRALPRALISYRQGMTAEIQCCHSPTWGPFPKIYIY